MRTRRQYREEKSFAAVTETDYLESSKHPPVTVETACGIIEYADRGSSPAILSIHGGPGGYDQGLVMAEVFRING